MNDWALRSSCCSLLLAQLFVTAVVSGVSIVRENILEGSNATLRCDIERLHDDVQQTLTTYYWSKRIVANADGTVFLFYNSPTGSEEEVRHPSLIGRARFKPPVLSITNLKVSDSGYYSCEITSGNDGHRETKIFDLQVNAIPRVSVRRIDNPIINKDTQLYEAAFCQALRSKPNASVYWINANTGTRVEDSGERIVVSADGTSNSTSVLRLKPGLIGRTHNSIDPVTVDETIGNFTCITIHDWFPNDNKRIEKTIRIELLYPPRASVSVNGNRLTCNAIGNPMPDVTWIRPDGSVAKGRRHIYVNQSTPDRSSGRYTCEATSLIASAMAVINIEKSKQLPTILSTTLRYETAIPTSARNFDMECTAELEGVKSLSADAIFKWMRNGVEIDDDTSYQVMVNTSVASLEKTIVSSTLRIIQVMRSIDESIFRCRLDISNQLSGYVRSVERSIRLKIDYPPLPGSISVSVHPHPAAKEGEDVTLRCTATSMPPSSYRWFYEGKVLSSSSQLRLMNVSRYEAGKYKCVAFNYVPGSASSEVNVTVHYPPGDVTITKTRDSLDCSTSGGSIPAPFFTWLLPNGTTTLQNTSALRLSSLDTHQAASYICLVRNKLAEKNSTYFLQPSKLGIGSLSIAGFSVTMVAVFLTIVILIAILCFAKHRHVRKKSPSDDSPALNRSNLLGYAENSSSDDGSFASTPAPHNVFDDESVTVPKYDEAARTDESFGDSQGTSSKMKSIETLRESGVEMMERCPFESPIKSSRPGVIVATKGNQQPNGQLKLSTFSQPISTGEFNAVTPNYFTIRNQNRPKHEATLTRAFSETFKAGHLGIEPKADTGLVSRFSPSMLAAGQNAQVALPPSYTQLTSLRNSQAGRRGIASPTPVSLSSVDGKNDDGNFHLNEATTLSPQRLTSPVPHEQLHKMDIIPPNKFTTRNNLIPRSIDRACSPLNYGQRDGTAPSRCQSVDTTRETAAIVGLPDRKYAYRPYPDGSKIRPSTTVAFNKSNGTDSIAPTSVTSGGKLQSLTLV